MELENGVGNPEGQIHLGSVMSRDEGTGERVSSWCRQGAESWTQMLEERLEVRGASRGAGEGQFGRQSQVCESEGTLMGSRWGEGA